MEEEKDKTNGYACAPHSNNSSVKKTYQKFYHQNKAKTMKTTFGNKISSLVPLLPSVV